MREVRARPRRADRTLRPSGRIAGGKCAAGQSRPTQGQPTGSATHPRSALSCGSRTVVQGDPAAVLRRVRRRTPPHANAPSRPARSSCRSRSAATRYAAPHPSRRGRARHRRSAGPRRRTESRRNWVAGSRCSAADRSPPDRGTRRHGRAPQDAHQDRISLRDHPFAEFERRRVDGTAGEIDDGAGALHLEDGRPPVLVAVGGSLGNQCGHHVRMVAWTSMPPSRVGCVICTLYPLLRKNSPTRQFVGTFWGSAERLCWYEACGATENANSCMHRAFWRLAGLHEPICANGGGCTCRRRSGATATGRRADDHGRRRSDTGVDV